jgi:hypothetical protein
MQVVTFYYASRSGSMYGNPIMKDSEPRRFHVCSLCGKRRSHPPRMRKEQDLDDLICSRAQCVKVKSAFTQASHASTIAIEVHHYLHSSHCSRENNLQINTPELRGQSIVDRVELPTDFTQPQQYVGQNRLPTIPEGPPPVNTSTKPTQDFVEWWMRRTRW